MLADLFADSSHLTKACLGLLATASSRRLCHQDVVAATKWWWGGGGNIHCLDILCASNSNLNSLNPHPHLKPAQLSSSNRGIVALVHSLCNFQANGVTYGTFAHQHRHLYSLGWMEHLSFSVPLSLVSLTLSASPGTLPPSYLTPLQSHLLSPSHLTILVL